MGLLLSNGPGAISAQGAKGAVAADGPEAPGAGAAQQGDGRLPHPHRLRHGGNGYEGIAFLLEQFRGQRPARSGASPGTASTCKALASRYVERICALQVDARSRRGSSTSRSFPASIIRSSRASRSTTTRARSSLRELMEKRGEYNVFHDYYRELVQALFDGGVSRNVFCVNVDAVIAALLLKMLWEQYRSGALSGGDLETAAFTIFLYARMLGCAAEIDDHLNRGRNMDTRTPASQCRSWRDGPAGANAARNATRNIETREHQSFEDSLSFPPPPPSSLPPWQSKVATVLRVTSGNFLEMFDFFLFGFYATYISKAFFPAGSEFASLMLTFMTFGAGFLMRPLGAIVLGAYIDQVGRRKGLIITLAIMAMRHDPDRVRAGLRDDRPVRAVAGADRAAAAGLLRRRRAGRRLGLSRRDGNARATRASTSPGSPAASRSRSWSRP